MGQYVKDVETVLNHRNAKKEAQTERQKIIADMQKTKTDRANMIKKALAAQRARFGAGGGGGGMSKDAVLERLKNETAESYNEQLRRSEEKLRRVQTPRRNFLKTFATRFDSLM